MNKFAPNKKSADYYSYLKLIKYIMKMLYKDFLILVILSNIPSLSIFCFLQLKHIFINSLF